MQVLCLLNMALFYKKEYFENLLQEMLNDGLIEKIKPIPEF
jgi:hypothetical protein